MTSRCLEPLSLPTDRLRNPEYTGEKRYFPCTLFNLSLGTAASVVVAVLSPPGGLLLFVVSLLAVYLRGYLVPGTPAVTERYFRDSRCRLSDATASPPTAPEDTVESFLRHRGALRTVEEGTDLELRPSFRAELRDRVGEYDTADRLLAAVTMFIFGTSDRGVEAGDLTITRRPNTFVLRYEGRPLAEWESRAAMVGDVAAAAVFAERTDDWDAMDPLTRLRVLGTLRLWYEQCPSCWGSVSLGRREEESSCRSFPVLVATCDTCGSRVFETDYDDSLAVN